MAMEIENGQKVAWWSDEDMKFTFPIVILHVIVFVSYLEWCFNSLSLLLKEFIFSCIFLAIVHITIIMKDPYLSQPCFGFCV